MEEKLLNYIIHNFFNSFNKTNTNNYLIKNNIIYKINLIIDNKTIIFNDVMNEDILIDLYVNSVYSDRLFGIYERRFIFNNQKYCIVGEEKTENINKNKKEFY